MKRTSAFLELAERIDERSNIDLYEFAKAIRELHEVLNSNITDYFINLNRKEQVICLLLAHEIWCDTIDKD